MNHKHMADILHTEKLSRLELLFEDSIYDKGTKILTINNIQLCFDLCQQHYAGHLVQCKLCDGYSHRVVEYIVIYNICSKCFAVAMQFARYYANDLFDFRIWIVKRMRSKYNFIVDSETRRRLTYMHDEMHMYSQTYWYFQVSLYPLNRDIVGVIVEYFIDYLFRKHGLVRL